MKYALLDDQIQFHDEFKTLTKEYITLENCDFYTNSKSLFSVLENTNRRIDVVFLDIESKNENGLEIAKKLYNYNPSIMICFLTNQAQYVYDAFGLNVLRFIYKPHFKRQVDDLFQMLMKEIDLSKPIYVKYKDTNVSLAKKEILMVSIESRKIVFHTINGKDYISNLKNINEALEMMDSSYFVLINRAEIINMNYIKEMIGTKLVLSYFNKICYISRDRLSMVKELRGKMYV